MGNSKVSITILFTVLLVAALGVGFAKAEAITVNGYGKTEVAGLTRLSVASKCGQNYILVSPVNSTSWNITVYIKSVNPSQSVNIAVYEAVGEYPYDYQDQIDAPHANGIGEALLESSLDPQRNYEVWVRDAYAENFTGYIEEEWGPSPEDYMFQVLGDGTSLLTSEKSHTGDITLICLDPGRGYGPSLQWVRRYHFYLFTVEMVVQTDFL